ncbi:MAG: hypothetical protein WCG78_03490 [Candidatus Omnitrophota bacterium]
MATATSGKIRLTILDPDAVVYRGEASTIFVAGETGEFELLPYHYPVLCLLKEDSDIIIDSNEFVTIRRGILKLFKNECTIIAELAQDYADYYKKKSLL